MKAKSEQFHLPGKSFLSPFITHFYTTLILIVFSLSSCVPQNSKSAGLLNDPVGSSTPILETSVLNQMATPAITDAPIPTASDLIPSTQDPIAQITHDGVSIDITWVYADADRISIEYKIKGIQIPNGYQMYCPVHLATLTDSTGKKYDPYDWPFPQQPPENLTYRCQRDQNGEDFTLTQNYFRKVSSDNEIEQLTWDIKVGGFDIFTQDGAHTWLPEKGPFIFNLTVPVTQGLTIEPAQTMSINGLTVRLDRVTVFPTYTDVTTCIFYDNNKEWYPDITFSKGGESVPIDATTRTDVYGKSFPTYQSLFTAERCYRFSFNIASPETYRNSPPQNMAVTFNNMIIDALNPATQQDYLLALKKAQSKYPDLDFSVEIDNADPQKYGFGIQINQIPDGMDYATAQKIAEDSFKSIVQGPLRFEIPIP